MFLVASFLQVNVPELLLTCTNNELLIELEINIGKEVSEI
jgi:hypothetical protein